MKNLIEQCLLENIKNENSVFVFPTQIAAELWADRIIEISEVKAVAMERFMAWDDFKGNSIKTTQKDRHSIPGTIRKIFAQNLVEQNQKEPFLKHIILPEYADFGKSYSSYIAKLLPSLKLWKKYFDRSGAQMDLEDQDLLEIYKRYSDFLDANFLFDPAWEEPPFVSDGHHYFVFFPQILSDYSEYKEILEKSKDDITVINFDSLNQEEKKSLLNQKVNFYSDSRSEIHQLCLFLNKIHNEKNIPWNEIAVSVPDLDSYGPYLERDFDLYQIPFLSRNAKPLSANRAGSIFKTIQACINSDFAFADAKDLLLNSNLPWKNKSLIQKFIDFGKANNCICSYNYNGTHHDVWLESFDNLVPRNPGESKDLSDLKSFYKKISSSLKAFSRAQTFEELRTAYFTFKNDFFCEEEFLPQADLIISREIAELGNLIDLEAGFPDLKLNSPFDFFIEYIDGKKYLAQTSANGVRILPYKTAATAPFKCHVIVDASQESLSVVYTKLNFLRDDKRQALKLGEENVSDDHVMLYAMNSTDQEVYFSCGVKTFTGYAQAFSGLTEENRIPGKENYVPENYGEDFIEKEKNFVLSQDKEKFPANIFEWQKQSFDNWNSNSVQEAENNFSAKEILSEKIAGSTQTKENMLKASKSSMDKYFACPRMYLFRYALGLEEEDNDASLINPFATGNLLHSALENFANCLKEKGKPLFISDEGLNEEYLSFLNKSLDEAILHFEGSYLAKQQLWAIRDQIFLVLLNAVSELSHWFLGTTVFATERAAHIKNEEGKLLSNGRIDLILRDQKSDQLILVDYKTGSAPKNIVVDPEDADQSIDLQVPMYLHLFESEHEEFNSDLNTYEKADKIKIDNACFFTIAKAELKPVFGSYLKERLLEMKPRSRSLPISKEEFADTQKCFDQLLNQFNTRVHDTDFKVDPRDVHFEDCAVCGYKGICRRSFTVSKQN